MSPSSPSASWLGPAVKYRAPGVTLSEPARNRSPHSPEMVIGPLYHPPAPVPGATIRPMPGDLERLPVVGRDRAVLAAELLGRVRAELPVIGELGERDQVLVWVWLTGLRSARTRRAYAGDVAAWLGWLAGRDTDVLAAGRVHVDLWAATWLDAGAAASSVRRHLSALSSFYRYCAACDLTGRIPTEGVARPAVDPDYTATVGLDRDQARALVAAADADTAAQALRTAAVVRLLLHNALRVDEACAADIADLGEDSGHRVLRVVRKGARKAKVPLTRPRWRPWRLTWLTGPSGLE
jgi:integrase/recombinase XerD